MNTFIVAIKVRVHSVLGNFKRSLPGLHGRVQVPMEGCGGSQSRPAWGTGPSVAGRRGPWAATGKGPGQCAQSGCCGTQAHPEGRVPEVCQSVRVVRCPSFAQWGLVWTRDWACRSSATPLGMAPRVLRCVRCSFSWPLGLQSVNLILWGWKCPLSRTCEKHQENKNYKRIFLLHRDRSPGQNVGGKKGASPLYIVVCHPGFYGRKASVSGNHRIHISRGECSGRRRGKVI